MIWMSVPTMACLMPPDGERVERPGVALMSWVKKLVWNSADAALQEREPDDEDERGRHDRSRRSHERRTVMIWSTTAGPSSSSGDEQRVDDEEHARRPRRRSRAGPRTARGGRRAGCDVPDRRSPHPRRRARRCRMRHRAGAVPGAGADPEPVRGGGARCVARRALGRTPTAPAATGMLGVSVGTWSRHQSLSAPDRDRATTRGGG